MIGLLSMNSLSSRTCAWPNIVPFASSAVSSFGVGERRLPVPVVETSSQCHIDVSVKSSLSLRPRSAPIIIGCIQRGLCDAVASGQLIVLLFGAPEASNDLTDIWHCGIDVDSGPNPRNFFTGTDGALYTACSSINRGPEYSPSSSEACRSNSASVV